MKKGLFFFFYILMIFFKYDFDFWPCYFLFFFWSLICVVGFGLTWMILFLAKEKKNQFLCSFANSVCVLVQFHEKKNPFNGTQMESLNWNQTKLRGMDWNLTKFKGLTFSMLYLPMNILDNINQIFLAQYWLFTTIFHSSFSFSYFQKTPIVFCIVFWS